MNERVLKEIKPASGNLKKSHLKMFERLANTPDGPPIEKKLCFICSPRCGSTLFTDTLNQTGLIGFCEEWFNYEYFAAYQHVLGKEYFTLRDYLNFVQRKGVGSNGIWSVKWHVAQMATMVSDFDYFYDPDDFDLRIYLYRRNKVAQAVSLAKAVASNQFRADEVATNDPTRIDMFDISECLMKIISHDKSYHTQLARTTEFMFAYEDFATGRDNYDTTLKALGFDPPEKYQTKMKKQRDAHSETMCEKFLTFIKGEYV